MSCILNMCHHDVNILSDISTMTNQACLRLNKGTQIGARPTLGYPQLIQVQVQMCMFPKHSKNPNFSGQENVAAYDLGGPYSVVGSD